MNKVNVSVPKTEKGKWVVNGHYHRASAATVLGLTERLLSRLTTEGKTCVRVNYGKGYHNESVPSQNVPEQLYALSCFLEDYLSEKTLGRIGKNYLGTDYL